MDHLPPPGGATDPAFPDQPRPWTSASIRDPVFLLSKIGDRATKLFAEALKPLGIRPRHVAALRFMVAREGASQRDLVEGLWSDSSSVVTLLDDFEQRGLAERRRNATDRRAYSIYVTPRGFEILEAALRLSDDVEQAMLARLSAEKQAQLLALLVETVGGVPDDQLRPEVTRRLALAPSTPPRARTSTGGPGRLNRPRSASRLKQS
jgi:DNA-binding MarR family transcriptional regulator